MVRVRMGVIKALSGSIARVAAKRLIDNRDTSSIDKAQAN